jgi:hypothetical protein
VFRQQSWQRYRIKDTDKGPEVWEVKWSVFWRKAGSGLPTRRHCLIVARNVLTGEVKYFLANRVPGEWNPFSGQYITLRWLLRVAFGRWSIESCFRQSKEELGMDHYEVRGWRCLHRHFYLTQLTHLFCARIRQQYDQASDNGADRLTVEQVRSAVNAWLECVDLCRSCRQKRYEKELEDQQYHQARNEQARVSHTKTRVEQLVDLGATTSAVGGHSGYGRPHGPSMYGQQDVPAGSLPCGISHTSLTGGPRAAASQSVRDNRVPDGRIIRLAVCLCTSISWVWPSCG